MPSSAASAAPSPGPSLSWSQVLHPALRRKAPWWPTADLAPLAERRLSARPPWKKSSKADKSLARFLQALVLPKPRQRRLGLTPWRPPRGGLATPPLVTLQVGKPCVDRGASWLPPLPWSPVGCWPPLRAEEERLAERRLQPDGQVPSASPPP